MNAATWRSVGALITLRPWLFVSMGVLVGIAAYGVQLVPAFFARQFIDALSGNENVGLNLWTPLALLAAFALVRPAVMLGAFVSERALQMIAGTLLRRNALEHILRQPGAQPLPAAPGEAISRFRDDVQAVVQGLSWMLDPVGQLVFAIVVVVTLLRIDPSLTIGVTVPLLVVVGMVRLLSAR